jgi:hypothetical protein
MLSREKHIKAVFRKKYFWGFRGVKEIVAIEREKTYIGRN